MLAMVIYWNSVGSVTLQSDTTTNTNFFLPDLRNRSAIGIGQNDTNSLSRTLGQQGGSDDTGSDGTLDPFLATNFIIRAKPNASRLLSSLVTIMMISIQEFKVALQ